MRLFSQDARGGSFLFKPGGRDKGLEFALKQMGELDTSIISILRSYDLNSNRKTFSGKPSWRHRGGKVEIAGVSCPEHLGGRRLGFFIDHDHPFPALAFLIMGECGSRGRGT